MFAFARVSDSHVGETLFQKAKIHISGNARNKLNGAGFRAKKTPFESLRNPKVDSLGKIPPDLFFCIGISLQ